MAEELSDQLSSFHMGACEYCSLNDHATENCKACHTCYRHGHEQQYCPYDKPMRCSHCNSSVHHVSACSVMTCQVRGCDVEDFTWFHPHAAGQVTRMERAQIHGTQPARKTSDEQFILSQQYSNNLSPQGPQSRPSIQGDVYKPQSNQDTHRSPSVITNYVQINSLPKKLFVYSIAIPSPKATAGDSASDPNPGQPLQVSQPSERKRVFQAMKSLPPLLNRTDFATNFELLWTLGPLDGPGRLADRSYVVPNVTYRKQSGRDETITTVTFIFKKELSFFQPSDLATIQDDGHVSTEAATVLNAIIGQVIMAASAQNIVQTDANRFYLGSAWVEIGHLLRVHRGYFFSVRPGTENVLLNINLKHAAFHNPYTVATAMVTFRNQSYGQPLDKLFALLKGLTVRIMYTRPRGENNLDRNHENNRKKIIVGFGLPPAVQQFVVGGKMKSVKEWFEEQGATLKHPNIPCVNVGLAPKSPQKIQEEQLKINQPDADRSNELWIPPELLEIELHQLFKRQLNEMHMREMLTIACQRPALNQGAIVEEGLPLFGIGNPYASQTQSLKDDFQLTLGNGLMEIPATVMKLPTIAYMRNNIQGGDIANASWNLKGQVFVRTEIFTKLDVFDLRYGKSTLAAGVIGKKYIEIAKNHGLFTGNTVQNFFVQTRDFSQGFSIDKVAAELNSLFKQRKSLTALVLMSTANPKLYCAVKTLADRAGLATICLVVPEPDEPSTEATLPGLSVFSNLLMKHNIKLDPRNINHTVLDPKINSTSAFASLGPDTLVVGVDVVHPGDALPSIAAMVASFDSNYVNFPGSISLQLPKVEILEEENIQCMFDQRLDLWLKKRRSAPRRLLYYRDGVGEDQRMEVLNREVSVMEACLRKRFAHANVPVTVIVVEKRHNTRFFTPGHNKKMTLPGLKGNVKPGVVIDSHITLPANQPGLSLPHKDFYLQSHAAVQGTARPAHYKIIRNDSGTGLDMEELQKLTLAFCFNFQRATKGISYCAPAYYADRLCDRAHHYLKFYRLRNSLPPKSDAEKAAGKDGDEQYKRRIRLIIAASDSWNLSGSRFPWAERLSEVMFWL